MGGFPHEPGATLILSAGSRRCPSGPVNPEPVNPEPVNASGTA